MDRFWSFKLVLKNKVEAPGHDSSGGERLSFGSSLHGMSSRTVPESGDGVSSFADYEIEDEFLPSKELGGQPSVSIEYPTSEQLDQMNIAELRRLRRKLALVIHPDRLSQESANRHNNSMGRWNRLIDDAINKRSADKTG